MYRNADWEKASPICEQVINSAEVVNPKGVQGVQEALLARHGQETNTTRSSSGALIRCGQAQSQSSSPGAPIAVTLTSGEVLHYEIETSTSYAADVLRAIPRHWPLGPCQYSLAAVLALRVESPGADGNLPVKAEYQDLKVTNWSCRELEQKKLEKGLRDFAASNVVYQVGPHGEVGIPHHGRDRFTYMSAVDLLNQVTLDLLQTRLADYPVAVGRS